MARTHSEIVTLWPSFRDMANELEAASGRNLNIEAVRLWHKRNRIPMWWWVPTVAAGKKRRLGLTVEELAMGMLKVNGS